MYWVHKERERKMNEQNFEDQQLQCVECGKIFVFSAEDQEFYSTKGYSAPKRCPECREARKSRSNSFHGGGQHRERREYPVICAACGRETTVPFKPSNDRPVYCSDCYKKGQQ